MIDPTDLDKKAMAAALKPLGEYVASIGMHRPLSEYTREEVLVMIDVVVTAFEDHKLFLESDIPF